MDMRVTTISPIFETNAPAPLATTNAYERPLTPAPPLLRPLPYPCSSPRLALKRPPPSATTPSRSPSPTATPPAFSVTTTFAASAPAPIAPGPSEAHKLLTRRAFLENLSALAASNLLAPEVPTAFADHVTAPHIA